MWVPVTLKLSLHYIVMSTSKFSLVWPSTAGARDEQLEVAGHNFVCNHVSF